MLELKVYGKPELSEMFGTKRMQGLKNKLDRYGVEYDVSGKAEKALFNIKKINNPFKVYCIVELGFDANTDFKALAYFYYYYFNDEEFMAMPDEVKMFRMDGFGKHVSRQTIAKYTSKLSKANLVYLDTTEFIYYFAYHEKQIRTDKKTYCEAWKLYWDLLAEGLYPWQAMNSVRNLYGGSPRKQSVPRINAFYVDEIKYIQTLVNQVIDDDMDNQF